MTEVETERLHLWSIVASGLHATHSRLALIYRFEPAPTAGGPGDLPLCMRPKRPCRLVRGVPHAPYSCQAQRADVHGGAIFKPSVGSAGTRGVTYHDAEIHLPRSLTCCPAETACCRLARALPRSHAVPCSRTRCCAGRDGALAET